MKQSKRQALVLAAAAVAGISGISKGANVTWLASPGNSLWSAADWTPSTPVPPTDALFFATSTQTSVVNDFAAGTTFASLNFNSGASGFTLNGNSVNFTGGVTLNQGNGAAQTINLDFTATGTLQIGTNQSGGNNVTFNGNSTVGGLNVNSNSSTVNALVIGAGKVLTVNGASTIGFATAVDTPTTTFSASGNELDMNGNLIIGLAETGAARGLTKADLSGLNAFRLTASTSNGSLGLSVNQMATGTLLLASASTNALNVLTAATITLSSTTSNAGTADLLLGQGSNVINANQINIGLGKGTGTINWQNANGSISISGTGTGSVNILMGSATSSTAGGVSAFLLAGHTANVNAGSITVGNLAGATGAPSSGSAGSLTFDTGVFNVASLTLANDTSGTASAGIAGTFTLGGSTPNNTATGVLNVNNLFTLGNRTNATGGTATAAFNVNGGTANINVNILDASTQASNTLVTLAGGALNMTGHAIGTAARPITTVNLPNGTQTARLMNLGGGGIFATTMNGGSGGGAAGGLVMNGTGTLLIDGPSNTYAGGTTISNGRLIALTNLPTGGAVALNGGTLAGISSIGNLTTQGSSHVVPGTTTLDGSIGTLTMSSLTVNGGDFRLDVSPTAGASDLVAVTGGATFNGGSITPVFAGQPTPGNYTLLTSGGLTISSAPTFNLPTSQTRLIFTPHFNDATSGANNISLQVAGNAANLTWTGAADTTSWDIVGQTNWTSAARTDGTDPTKYYDLDNVLFDDSTANHAITIQTTVSPGTVVINHSTGADYVFSGPGNIAGAGTISLTGSGNVVFATNNTYTGQTIISGGTLTIGAGTTSGSLGASTLVTNNSALVFNHSDTITVNNNITGTGIVEQGVTGSGLTSAVLKLGGSSSYTGQTNVKVGTIQPLSSNAFGNTSTTNGAVGDVVVTNGAMIDLNSGTTTANTLNFGSKRFVVVGTGIGGVGVITNTGVSQFSSIGNLALTGDALVSGVRFDVGRNGTGDLLDLAGHKLTANMNSGQIFGIEANATVNNGTIEVVQGVLDLERTVVVHSDVNGSNITLDSGVNLQLFETASGAVTRPIIVNGNNIIGAGDNTTANLDAPVTFTGGDLTFEQLTSGAGTLNGSGTLIVTGNLTESGGQFAINKNGNSNLVLSGNNTFSNGLNVNGGTVIVGGANALGASGRVSLNTGTTGLRLNGNPLTLTQANGNGIVSNASATPATLTLFADTGQNNGSSANLQDGAGGGALSITKTGNGQVSLQGQSNTYTGTTTISAGTLELQNSVAQGPILNNATLNFNSGGSLNYGGSISGGGVVRQNGGGSTTLSGSSGYSGTTEIDNGTLIVSGTLSATSAVNVNNGTMIVSGTLSGTSPVNVNNGTLVVNGTVNAAANINLNSDRGNPTLMGTGSVGKVVMGPNGGGQSHISPGATGLNSVGSITIANLSVAGGNPDFDLDLLTPGNNDFVNVTGNATFSTASTLSPNATAAPGTYTVLTAQGALALGVLPTINSPTDTRTSFTLDTTSDPHSIKLVAVSNGLTLTWRGDQGNSWDVNGTQNWTDNGVSTDQKFFQLDSVVFDNSGAVNNNNVNIGTAVFPTSIVLNNSAGNDYTFSGGGTISGNTGITMNGTGGLIIQTNNAYTGTTTVNSGTLTVGDGGSNGSLGTGPVVDNSALIINRGDTFTMVNAISGSGSFEKMSNGTVILAANNSYLGSTLIDGGTLQVGAGTTTGSLGAGNVLDNGTLVFNHSDTVTVANVISGPGDFVKAGAGQVNLTGSNSYTGPTFITAGTLSINSTNSIGDPTSSSSTISLGVATLMASGNIDLGTNRNIVLASSGTINVLNGNKLIVDGNITQTAAGTFAKNGSGTMVLSGTNSFGTLSILSGTVDFTSDSNLGGLGTQTVTFGGSGFIHPLANVTSGKFYYDSSNVNDQVNFLIDNGITMTLNRAAGGFRNGGKPMQKLGGGTLVLASDNAQTDTGILINGGTIVFQTAGSTGGIGGGNTISLATGGAANLQNDASTNYNNATLAVDSTAFLVTGNGGIFVDRQTPGDGVTHTVGSIGFNAGGNTLTVAPGSNITTVSNGAGLVVAQNVTLNDNGTINVMNSATAPMTVTLGAPVTGSFGLTKTGNGTLIFAGNNTYTGPATIAGGTTLNRSAVSQSLILTGTGGGAIMNSGTLAFDYSATGSNSDPAATISSILAASQASNFAAGQIRTTNTPDSFHAIGWVDDTTNKVVSVKYTYAGDSNLSGSVDTSDFAAMALHFGQTGATWQQGDFNYDGVVNALDFNAIATNFGQTTLPAAPVLGALVPEPASLSLLALGAGLLARRRRAR